MVHATGQYPLGLRALAGRTGSVNAITGVHDSAYGIGGMEALSGASGTLFAGLPEGGRAPCAPLLA